jgi:hypothetical protein
MSLAELPWIWGPLLDAAGSASLLLPAVLEDLRPAMIPKGQVGKHHRAVSRNGRVLLASHCPAEELAGQRVLLRVAVWHRRHLPGDPPRPYGVLLTVRLHDASNTTPLHRAVLAEAPLSAGVLHLDLGGRRILSLVAQSRSPGD